VLVGLTSPLTVSGASTWQQQTAGIGATGSVVARFSDNANPPRFLAVKSRGTSVGTNTIVQNGDELGSVDFAAADGTSYTTAARISAAVDGTPGTGDLPARLTFNLASDGSTTLAEGMRIDSSGRVAIGTATPNASATTTIKSAATGDYQIQLEQSNVTDGYALRCSAANGDLTFSRYASSAYSERMRLDVNGNLQLGYGGQSPTAFSAPQGMTIGSLDNVALQYYLRKGNQVEARIGFKASTDSNFYVGSGGGTGPGGIGAYGVYLTNLGSSWNAVSDERMKTIIEPIENAAEKVSSLRAVIGYYNNDESQTRRPFLIAQDVQDVLPEAVNIQNLETGTLGMSYTDTIPLLVAAIKEQQALITALTARITVLEGA
jgi:hypothetical protein